VGFDGVVAGIIGCELVVHSKCLMICFNEYVCIEIFGVI
jgi:hypothetical protein